MMFSDLQDKINALYGYTPSQSNLLQNPELLDMAIMAIAANATDLSAIATAYNTLMGTSLTSGDLIAQPDKTKLGILAIASSTTSLSTLATSYNTLMGINFTASSILLRPDLVKVAMLATWAAVTDLATLTAKVNALMGWTPPNAQLLNNSQLLEIALAAVIGDVSDLSAIATEYNAVMGTSFSGSDLLASPEKIARGAFFLIDSAPVVFEFYLGVVCDRATTYTDSFGNLWLADTYFTGGDVYGVPGPIAGTPDQDLFLGERYGNFSYALPTATNDLHKVDLLFREGYWQEAAARVFNVRINGTLVLTNFDIFAEAGYLTALTRTFDATPVLNVITIAFETVVDNAVVSALSLRSQNG